MHFTSDFSAAAWHHIVPLGRFPHAPSGLAQVLDAPAARSMVEQFEREAREPNFPGLLIDFDHASAHPDKPTEAAGWITGLRAETQAGPGAGVYAQIRWSDAGEAAVRGGRYRLVSPVWLAADLEPADAAGGVRPRRLHRLALTNDPNLKGLAPLSNRAAAPATGESPKPLTDRREAARQNQRKEPMREINESLGLPPEAAGEAALAAIQQIQNRCASLAAEQAALARQNQELRAAQAEAEVAQYADRFDPAAREAWRAALLANRARTLELLRSLPEHPGPASGAPPRPPQHQRAQAKTPAYSPGGGPAGTAEIQRQAVQEYKNRRHCSWQDAWDALRHEQPDLFAPPATNH